MYVRLIERSLVTDKQFFDYLLLWVATMLQGDA